MATLTTKYADLGNLRVRHFFPTTDVHDREYSIHSTVYLNGTSFLIATPVGDVTDTYLFTISEGELIEKYQSDIDSRLGYIPDRIELPGSEETKIRHCVESIRRFRPKPDVHAYKLDGKISVIGRTGITYRLVAEIDEVYYPHQVLLNDSDTYLLLTLPSMVAYLSGAVMPGLIEDSIRIELTSEDSFTLTGEIKTAIRSTQAPGEAKLFVRT